MTITNKFDRLKVLQQRWGISKQEIFLALELGNLRACIWLPPRYMERAKIKDGKITYEVYPHMGGFVGVLPGEFFAISSMKTVQMREFESLNDNYPGRIRLAYKPPQPDILVSLYDLIILRDDRIAFEKERRIKPRKRRKSSMKNIPTPEPTQDIDEFFSSDCRQIKFQGMEFNFGEMQSKIISILYEASNTNTPWVNGKTLLKEAGSRTTRLRDLFRNQKDWQKIISSNERGYYRLNVPNRIALFPQAKVKKT